MTNTLFKTKNNLEKRKQLSENFKKSYPKKIPIIVESKDIVLTKNKFLTDGDQSISLFMSTLRKFLTLKKDEAVFLFINNTLPSQSESLSSIYKKFGDEDGFLYCQLSKESTFG
jgi:GABA(A) receptor-associated protein